MTTELKNTAKAIELLLRDVSDGRQLYPAGWLRERLEQIMDFARAALAAAGKPEPRTTSEVTEQ